MQFVHRFLLVSCALASCVLAGCNLVNSSGLQTDYSFDALEYASPEFGDPKTSATVPDVPCEPSGPDVCATAAAALPVANVTFSCDATLKKCIARAEVRASEAVDLSKQTESSFPAQAIQFGVDVVEVKRVTYWVTKNMLNVATPVIEFYVAPSAAHDETDPKAALFATVAALPAKSNACGDPAYPNGDPKANGAPVCSAPLPEAGKSALAAFVKDFKTPFQVIAHTVIIAKPGEPIPSGSIGFAARPTVGLKILD